MKILVLGGDGFCGWPTALRLSSKGHEVAIVDNLARRAIDEELSARSLTPIATVRDRLAAWHDQTGRIIEFHFLDLANQLRDLHDLMMGHRPDAVVHFAEQRAAPYSMKSPRESAYTIDNNVRATHNVLLTVAHMPSPPHLVHLGTMGVYGYKSHGAPIPEGYLPVALPARPGEALEILYPTDPGSVYHLTKSMDQIMFQFYAKNYGLRVTDLHQGIVWGTQTRETMLHDDLVNRFDYDGDFGTVLNRFVTQAVVGHPLTVHGTGGQTRAFIHIEDSVSCIELALSAPPASGERVTIRNQATETHRVIDLANLVARLLKAEISMVPNPREELEENDLEVSNSSLLGLGLHPTRLNDGLIAEVEQVVRRYADRVDPVRIPSISAWNASRQRAINEELTHAAGG